MTVYGVGFPNNQKIGELHEFMESIGFRLKDEHGGVRLYIHPESEKTNKVEFLYQEHEATFIVEGKTMSFKSYGMLTMTNPDITFEELEQTIAAAKEIKKGDIHDIAEEEYYKRFRPGFFSFYEIALAFREHCHALVMDRDSQMEICPKRSMYRPQSV